LEQLRVDVNDGRDWVESMTKTLERLDGLCANLREAHKD